MNANETAQWQPEAEQHPKGPSRRIASHVGGPLRDLPKPQVSIRDGDYDEEESEEL